MMTASMRRSPVVHRRQFPTWGLANILSLAIFTPQHNSCHEHFFILPRVIAQPGWLDSYQLMFPIHLPALQLEEGGKQEQHKDNQRDGRSITKVEGLKA